MNRNSRRGPLPADLFTRYVDNPVRADWGVFGRRAHADRRGFLRGAGLATMGARFGVATPFRRQMPADLILVTLAEEMIASKDRLTLLNDRPLNAETPPHSLNDEVTPTAHHFIRNNGIPPEDPDMAGWRLIIDVLVDRPMTLSIAELDVQFEVVRQNLAVGHDGLVGRAGARSGARAFHDLRQRRAGR